MDDVIWANISACQNCGCDRLVKLQNEHHKHTAAVWDGSAWRIVKHGSLRCYHCSTIHKLNYMSMAKQNLSFLTTLKNDQIYLINPSIGFTLGFAKQLWSSIHFSSSSNNCARFEELLPSDVYVKLYDHRDFHAPLMFLERFY